MSVVRVKEGLSFDLSTGEQVNLRRGQLFPTDHPFVKGREQFFEPAEDAATRSSVGSGAAAVETAAAAPGSRRVVTRTRRSDDGEV